jgi:hypothetical protein
MNLNERITSFVDKNLFYSVQLSGSCSVVGTICLLLYSSMKSWVTIISFFSFVEAENCFWFFFPENSHRCHRHSGSSPTESASERNRTSIGMQRKRKKTHRMQVLKTFSHLTIFLSECIEREKRTHIYNGKKKEVLEQFSKWIIFIIMYRNRKKAHRMQGL